MIEQELDTEIAQRLAVKSSLTDESSRLAAQLAEQKAQLSELTAKSNEGQEQSQQLKEVALNTARSPKI